MIDNFEKSPQLNENNSLPFSYIRISTPNENTLIENRLRKNIFNKTITTRTDEEILNKIKNDTEKKEWYTSKEWREKGLPDEQIKIHIGDKTIDLYNWGEQLSAEHVEILKNIFTTCSQSFPDISNQLKYILINNKQEKSVYDDEDNYPLNGLALKDFNSIELFPRAIDINKPHRFKFLSNFEGTVVHEVTHLIQDKFIHQWNKNFNWDFCSDNNQFIQKETPTGEKKWFDTKNNEFVPTSIYPRVDSGFVNHYARLKTNEDICESMIAYLYEPEVLKNISPTKFNIFNSLDSKLTVPDIIVTKVKPENIKLPEIKSKTINYYIAE